MTDESEPTVPRLLGCQAILGALETCMWFNEENWYPKFFNSDYGHGGIFEYMTSDDWKVTDFTLSSDGRKFSNDHFESLDHCLIALAWAATLADVKVEDVIV